MSEQKQIPISAPNAAPAQSEHAMTAQALNSGDARDAVIREVSSWDGVVVGEHRFGGVEFGLELANLDTCMARLLTCPSQGAFETN